MQVLYQCCCGMDVHKRFVVACLLWQDEAGNTWLSYNDPSWLAKRHGTGRDTEATIAALSGALQAFAKSAAGSP